MRATLLLLAIAGVLLGLAVLRPGAQEGAFGASQQHSACRHLPGLAGQLCAAYQSAVGRDKFAAAAHWRQRSPASYACSGVDMDCLQADMRSSSAASSCLPRAEGSSCNLEQQQQQQMTCSAGFCGGRPEVVEPFDPSFQPAAASTCLGRAAARMAALLTGGSATAHHGAAPDTAGSSDDADAVVPRSLQQSESVVTAGVNPGWPTAYATVKARDGGKRIPDHFLATSHEWTRLTDYGGENSGAWAEIFKVLGPAPVLRIGGATQDKLVEPPKDETWAALRNLQKATGARYIIGLPLAQKNAVEMAQQMIGRAKKYLGSSVIGYELGNEPEFWLSGLGGWTKNGTWEAGFGAYSQWFDRVARTLNPCGSTPFLSGPGWGNVNTQDPNWLKIVLNNGKACGYLWEANTHYYPYIDNTTVTADQLLAQPLQDFGVERFKAYVRIAQDGHALPLRISEANSLYGGGRSGLSDTMAGTLWVADALFAFANAGAKAFHLHWGHGGLPHEGGSPNVGVQTNFDYNTPYPYVPYPSVHAPWYGYLFWLTASAGGYGRNADSQFVSAWMEKAAPAALAPPPPPAPAPAPAKVVTEKGASGSSSNSTKASSSSSGDKGNSSGPGSNLRLPARPARVAPVKTPGRRLLAAAQNKTQTAACTANVKVWALKADDGSLRVALFNKDSKQPCNMRVSIPDAAQFCSAGRKAALSRLLPGPEGMASRSGLSWQGQHYEDSSVATSGKLVGGKAVGSVSAAEDAAGCAFTVGMPATSAALLVIKASE